MCGKLSKPERFGIDDDGVYREDSAIDHELQIATQYFVGRGQGGFQWEREEASSDVLEALRQCALAVYWRLSKQLGIEPESDDE